MNFGKTFPNFFPEAMMIPVGASSATSLLETAAHVADHAECTKSSALGAPNEQIKARAGRSSTQRSGI
jgi:hypothetical protein